MKTWPLATIHGRAFLIRHHVSAERKNRVGHLATLDTMMITKDLGGKNGLAILAILPDGLATLKIPKVLAIGELPGVNHQSSISGQKAWLLLGQLPGRAVCRRSPCGVQDDKGSGFSRCDEALSLNLGGGARATNNVHDQDDRDDHLLANKGLRRKVR